MGLLADRLHPPPHHNPASEGSIEPMETEVGDESPRYRYSHSQAIVMTVESHTSQTEIVLLYSTL